MSTAPRIGLFGAGRLGSGLAEALGDQVAWQVTREAPPHADVDVVVEVSHGDAVAGRLDWALEHRRPLVIGSTDWRIDDLRERVEDRIGVVVAPNFSLGVALLRRLTGVLGRFANLDPSYDPYVFEHHRGGKRDAPSGTARILADALLAGCTRKTAWRLDGPLGEHELGVGVLRAGHTYSEHRVGVDAPDEVLEIRHTARNVRAFAAGVRAAAAWILGRHGVFTMDDVAASVVDPLFEGAAGGGS